LFDTAVAQPLPQQLALEAERQRELIDGPAFAGGARGFAERREPVFAPRG